MSILADILATKRAEVASAREARPESEVERAAAEAPAPRGLARALHRPEGAPLRAIAEIKRASPSAGPIRPGADPAEVARAYETAGAAALSVLTDERYFDGRLEFVTRAREATSIPILRKDFVIDRYQVAEARAAGADGVLVIVAALADEQLGELVGEVDRWGMDALVEVHDEAEADRAAAAGARVFGVNHRDLATFSVDMSLTGRLAPRAPAGAVLVAESGIRSGADARALAGAGAHAVLVGEHLMRADAPGDALAALLREAAA